jgi:arsenite methyltransferase
MTDYLEKKFDLNDPKIATVLDELSFWSSRFGTLLFNHLELVRDIRVLDLGFGLGFPLIELAHVHGSSCRFIGVDIWKAAMDRAVLKLKVYGLENVSLVRADGARLPLADDSFDLIVSNLGINNFEDPRAVLAECFRVAKPGARLVLTSNLKGHMQQFYDLYRETLVDLGKSRYLDRLAVNEAHRGTKESISGMVEGAGFRVLKIVEDRFYLRYLDGSAMLRHSLTRVGFLGGWRAVLEPEEEREVFTILEERLNKLARRDGELKMTVPMLYLEARR